MSDGYLLWVLLVMWLSGLITGYTLRGLPSAIRQTVQSWRKLRSELRGKGTDA